MPAPVVICARPVPAGVWDCEVAGQAVRLHIAECLGTLFGGDRPTAAATDTHLGAAAGQAGVLIVDGRAWFPPDAALPWLQPEAGLDSFRVVGHQSETLAVYFGRDALRRLADDGASLAGQCDAILDRTSVLARDAPLTVSPGMLIDGYDDVARLEISVLLRRAEAAMAEGVRLRDPGRVYIRGSLACGANVTIDVDVVFEGEVVLSDNVRVDAHCIVSHARIGPNTWVKPFSLVEGADIGGDCIVGPYARIRPMSRIGDKCQIGNFVEVKTSTIGAGCRINHHSFIGDAVLAERVTIGAGTITCNHDGTRTNQTVIGDDAYVGSGCQLVAPVRVGEAATIGAGSTITEDVPSGTLTVARSRQVTLAQWRGPRSSRHQR